MRINTWILLLAHLGYLAAVAPEIRGINFVSVPFTHAPYTGIRAKASLEHLKSTGANWVSIPVTWFQDDVDSSEMAPQREVVTTQHSVHRSPSDKEIRAVLKEAQDQDLSVMLVPQVQVNKGGWVRSSHIGERMSPYQVRRWFEKYEDFLVEVAGYAQAYNVKLLCIGHDLRWMAHYEDFWKQLIKRVREVFKGKLVYSASARTEFRQAGFFDELDYVGVIADEKISLGHRDEVPDIEQRLAQFVEKVEYLKKLWNKPIVVTRAARSGGFEKHSDGRVRKVHHHVQERFFHALHNALKDQVEGFFFGDWSADPAHGGEKDGSISPQYKPAEAAIRRIFGGDEEIPKQPSEESPKMYYKYCAEIDL